MRGGIFGGLKRALLGGKTFFVNRYVARGVGLLGLAPKFNGDIVHIPLEGRLFAQSGAFLASTPDVEIDTKWGGTKTFLPEKDCFC